LEIIFTTTWFDAVAEYFCCMQEKFIKKLTPEQIQASLYINGDENLLLEKFSKGDKVALVQLVMLQRPSIISYTSHEQHWGLPLTDVIDAATGGVIKLIEEQAALLSADKLKGDWQDNMGRYIHQAVFKEITDKKKINRRRKSYDTPERITFLNNLNNMLKELEQEIVDRAIACLEIGEQKQKDKDPFTVDYMVDAEVSYFVRKSDYHAHVFRDSFDYKTTVVDKDYGMLLDNGNGTDWHREGFMPELDEPYCYLLHDLMDHSRMSDKIFDIDMIWADITVKDQKGIKIKRDGQSRVLRHDKKRGGFV
jgi:hypothetical protein